jgi:hypothetical protein
MTASACSACTSSSHCKPTPVPTPKPTPPKPSYACNVETYQCYNVTGRSGQYSNETMCELACDNLKPTPAPATTCSKKCQQFRCTDGCLADNNICYSERDIPYGTCVSHPTWCWCGKNDTDWLGEEV